MRVVSRPDGFMLYGKLGVHFIPNSELLNPNKKVRLLPIGAWPKFHLISDNPYVSLGVADSSLYIRRVALKDDYHKEQMDMRAYIHVKLLADFGKDFYHSPKTKPVFSRKFSSSSDCYCKEYKLFNYWIVY